MFSKKKIIIFVSIFLFLFLICTFAIAAEPIKLQVPIGGVTEVSGEGGFGTYINNIYRFVIGAVGILAVVMIMWAGFLWMTARGSAEQVSKAKGYMSGAVIGLVLALGSFLILATVNPDTLKLEWPGMGQAQVEAAKFKSCEELNLEPSGRRCTQDSECCSGRCLDYCIEESAGWFSGETYWQCDVPGGQRFPSNQEQACINACSFCL